MELYGELVCTCLLNCRGDVGIDPDNQPCGHLRIRRRFLKKHCIPQADRVVRPYEPTCCKTGLLTKQQPLPE